MAEEKHIILTGYSRSGTTLLYNMLRSTVTNYTLFNSEASALQCLNLEDNIISKRPLDIFQINEILKANNRNKDISLIIIIRDIRGIITSVHKSVPNDYFIGYDYQYFVPQQGDPTYTNPGVVPIHNAIVKAMSIQGIKVAILKYEELLSDPGKLQDQLGKEFGLAYKDSFKNFHTQDIPDSLTLALNNVRPVDLSRINSWKDDKHKQRIRSQFTRCPILYDILVQYKYEPDRNWFREYDKRITE